MTFIFIVIWLLSVASAAETPFRVQSGLIQTKPKILQVTPPYITAPGKLFSIQFDQTFQTPPKISYSLKCFKGEDYLIYQTLFFKTQLISQTTFQLLAQVATHTKIIQLEIQILIIDASFSEIVLLNQIPIWYGSTLNKVNVFNTGPQNYQNSINFTQITGQKVNKFSWQVFLSGFDVVSKQEIFGGRYPMSFSVDIAIVTDQMFKINVNVPKDMKLQDLYLNIIFIDSQSFKSRRHGFDFWTINYGSNGGSIYLGQSSPSSFMMGLLDFKAPRAYTILNFRWEFRLEHGDLFADVKRTYIHDPIDQGLSGLRVSMISIWQFYCPMPMPYYSPSTGMCENDCPEFFYGDVNEQSCKKCTNFCSKCKLEVQVVHGINTQLLKCLQCSETHHRHLVSNACVCKQSFYQSPPSAVCASCPSHCLQCEMSGTPSVLTCLQCKNGYIKLAGICQKQKDCPLGQGIDSNNICQPCPHNCESCKRITQCKVCLRGYYLDSHGMCPQCSGGCTHCTNAHTCLECSWNLELSTGLCVCPTGTYEFNDVCENCHTECQTCSGPLSNNCLSCHTALHRQLSSNKCICNQNYIIIPGSTICVLKLHCPIGFSLNLYNTCDQICGDGIVVFHQCDDGNTLDGDGCSSECQIQDNFICDQDQQPSVCASSVLQIQSVVITKDLFSNRMFFDFKVKELPDFVQEQLKNMDLSNLVQFAGAAVQVQSVKFQHSSIHISAIYTVSVNGMQIIVKPKDPPGGSGNNGSLIFPPTNVTLISNNSLDLDYYGPEKYLQTKQISIYMKIIVSISLFCLLGTLLHKFAIPVFITFTGLQTVVVSVSILPKVTPYLQPYQILRLLLGGVIEMDSTWFDFPDTFVKNFNCFLYIQSGLVLLSIGIHCLRNNAETIHSISTFLLHKSVCIVFFNLTVISIAIASMRKNDTQNIALAVLANVGTFAQFLHFSIYLKQYYSTNEIFNFDSFPKTILSHTTIWLCYIFRMSMPSLLLTFPSNTWSQALCMGGEGLLTIIFFLLKPYKTSMWNYVSAAFCFVSVILHILLLKGFEQDGQKIYKPIGYLILLLILIFVINVLYSIVQVMRDQAVSKREVKSEDESLQQIHDQSSEINSQDIQQHFHKQEKQSQYSEEFRENQKNLYQRGGYGFKRKQRRKVESR